MKKKIDWKTRREIEKRISTAEFETHKYEKSIRPRRVTQLKASRLPLSYKGRRITKSEYQTYLASEHWRNFREQYFAEGKLQECFVCAHDEFELHHLTYERLWAEKLSDVLPLCKVCHSRVHNVVKRTGLSLERAPIYLKNRSLEDQRSYD